MKLRDLKEYTTNASAFHPTTSQRRVIGIILNCDTPQLALQELSMDDKLSAAKEQLQQLGMIVVTDQGVSLTATGEQMATSQALMDPTGQPSELSRTLAASDAGFDVNDSIE